MLSASRATVLRFAGQARDGTLADAFAKCTMISIFFSRERIFMAGAIRHVEGVAPGESD
jgi:hypothetical protein